MVGELDRQTAWMHLGATTMACVKDDNYITAILYWTEASTLPTPKNPNLSLTGPDGGGSRSWTPSTTAASTTMIETTK